MKYLFLFLIFLSGCVYKVSSFPEENESYQDVFLRGSSIEVCNNLNGEDADKFMCLDELQENKINAKTMARQAKLSRMDEQGKRIFDISRNIRRTAEDGKNSYDFRGECAEFVKKYFSKRGFKMGDIKQDSLGDGTIIYQLGGGGSSSSDHVVPYTQKNCRISWDEK